MFGEVGLGGEIRPVPHGQERVKAAIKQGFNPIIIPKGNADKGHNACVKPVSTVSEALAILLDECLSDCG